ncbi:trypsin-like serine protease [Streptomyces sp. NPDC050095]|uniref:trypsin-like serine peptidase n=1 Tax=unclassified Streptomyces TaxID=2593676 RepID=UPI00343FC127
MISILSVVALALTATTAAGAVPAPAAESPDEVRAFWTQERMAEAIADSAAPEPPDGVPWTSGAEPVRNVGRLFMELTDGRKATCTGAVVQAANRSVIATAGHCVHLKEVGGFMKKLLFVPAYDKGAKPYGSYVATAVQVDEAWQKDEDHKVDFSFVTLGPDEQGRSVENVTGARPAAFAPVAGKKTALGYPYVKPYDGETLQYCSGPTTPVFDIRLPGGEQLKPCRMTNGASGGPWYARDGKGVDVQVGVTSARPSEAGFEDVAWGAMFNDTAKGLYEKAASLR